MFNSSPETKSKLGVQRITALWAFSEAALGGILHVLKIPLTGLFIGSAAVIFISQIAVLAQSKSQILKSTMLVILVKAVVTPFVPLNSFFAVTLQGMLGFIFFSTIPSKKVSAMLLGISALSFAAFQKLFMMTILFGNAFWESIDSFVSFITSQIPVLNLGINTSASFIIILIYSSIHVIAGIIIGFHAGRFDLWIEKKSVQLRNGKFRQNLGEHIFNKQRRGKRKRWWQRKSGIVLVSFMACVMMITYFSPHLAKVKSVDVLFMLIRVIVFSLLWFNFISPLLVKWIMKFIEKKKFEHASEVNRITELFPRFNEIIEYCWLDSGSKKGLARIKFFFSNSLAYLLLMDFQ